MVFGVVFQVFGQFPDSARQQRDLDVCAAGVLPVQLELFDIHRFRILSHFEAPIVNEERPFASAGYFGGLLCSRITPRSFSLAIRRPMMIRNRIAPITILRTGS
jgi:hypothetical protein